MSDAAHLTAGFSIVGTDGDEQHATNGHVSLTLRPDGTNSRLRKRTAIKNACTPWVRREQWLYGELDGVRCYIRDDAGQVHIVMTKQDLYP